MSCDGEDAWTLGMTQPVMDIPLVVGIVGMVAEWLKSLPAVVFYSKPMVYRTWGWTFQVWLIICHTLRRALWGKSCHKPPMWEWQTYHLRWFRGWFTALFYPQYSISSKTHVPFSSIASVRTQTVQTAGMAEGSKLWMLEGRKKGDPELLGIFLLAIWHSYRTWSSDRWLMIHDDLLIEHSDFP